ncbi:ComC/BlpC family peptide pheromone/bacteriocin [Streptococcus fryi]
MNTQKMEQFNVFNEDALVNIEGGWFPWGGFIAGSISALDGGPTLDQLNGTWPKRNFPKPCTPYGIGGTPNACNGF